MKVKKVRKKRENTGRFNSLKLAALVWLPFLSSFSSFSFLSVAFAVETVTVPTPSGVPVVCAADFVEYQWAKKHLIARGKVRLSHLTMTLDADSMEWNVETGEILVDGHVTLWEGASRAAASTGRYHLSHRTAWLKDVEVVQFPWVVRGREMKKTTERDAYFIDGYLTTCEHPDHPHTKFAAGEIHVVLDEMIEASNMWLYAGPLPVLWIPYFSRSLKEGKSQFEIKPGFSSSEGWFVKTAYHVLNRDGLSADLFADYLTQLGYGLGAQALWDRGGDRSRVYGYYVLNPHAAQERWQVNVEHTQMVTPEFNVMGRLDMLSDERFPTDTTPYFYLSRYLRSYGALTYRLPFGSVTASAQDDHQFQLADQSYHRTSSEFPRLSFQMYSVPLGFGWFGGFGTEGVRTVYLPNGFHTEELWGWRGRVSPFASWTVPVYEGMTVGTSTSWTSTWDERRTDTGGFFQGNEGWTHGYGTSFFTHNEWLPMVSTDVSYSYGQQLQPLAAKGGVTSNRLGASVSMGRYDRLAVRMSTGYNFLPAPDELASPLQRYDPVSAELRMQSDMIEYRYATTYDVFRSAFTFVDNAIRGISPSGIEGQAGVNFARDAALNPVNLDIYGSLVVPVDKTFRWESGFRYELLNDLLKEQRYGLMWSFIDCWTFRASYIVRTSLAGTRPVDNAFFWFDIRLSAFPAAGPPIPLPGVLY